MSRFFVVVVCLAAAASAARHQKLSVTADTQPQATGHGEIVNIEFSGDYSAHGGKKYSSGAELTSLAHTSAIQAKTAVRNQQTAGIQAALGAQTGYARAALEAASTAQVALVAKQVIIQNLQRQLEDAEHQLQAELGQYQQSLQAANSAQNAAQQGQQQLSTATAALAAVQSSVQHSQQAASAALAAAAAQHAMIQDAKQRISRLHARLGDALDGLQETQHSAQRAAASAQVAQTNAAASAQLAVVNSANNQIDDHDDHSGGHSGGYHH